MTNRKAIDALIEKLEPDVRAAFRASMADIRANIDYPALLEALERGDIDAAIDALNIENASFNPYLASMLLVFASGGQTEAESIKAPPRIVVRFDMSNPRAESIIREHAGARIVGFVNEQVETAQRVILEGYSKGDGPRTIATEIAGRINPVTKRRDGGIIGLSDQQASYVQSMRSRLVSGEPAELRKVLGSFKDGKWIKGTGMTLRDRRFDGVIRKAIKTGEPIPQAKVDEMVARYSDRLIARRAEDVARTETAAAVSLAQKESYQQALDKHGLGDDAVTKTWRHSSLIENARVQHILMNRVSVQGLNTPFVLPDGSLMQHAHDPEGGVGNVVNCRCDTLYEINFGAGVL